MTGLPKTEPWLRGTLTDVPAIPRAVIHALELAREDITRWCSGLTSAQLNDRPSRIAPIAFHVRQIVRSIDRLLTYAEGNQLSAAQFAALKTELDPGAEHDPLFAEFNEGINRAITRIRAIDASGPGPSLQTYQSSPDADRR